MVKLSRLWIPTFLCIAHALQAAPPPAVEMSSLLEAFKLHHKSGRLDLNARTGANGAFIAPGTRLHVSIFRKGNSRPVATHAFTARKLGGIWSNVQVSGATHFEFKQAGDYTITYFANNKPITSFDFSIKEIKSDDPFQPVSYWFANGPWNDLAFLQVVNSNASTPLTFKFWTRQETPTPDNNMKASINLYKDGELVAVAGTGAVAWAEWSLKEFSFTFPQEQGGRKFSTADLLKNDGKYTITVKFDDQLQGHYHVVVASGKIVPHKRQAMGYQPTDKWLVPRRNQALDAADPIFWLQRSMSAGKSTEKKSARVTREQRKTWQVIPDADHKRPFQLVHTKVMTRRDTPIAAGDGIVAYSTGGSRGVGFLRTGEDRPQSIPNGQQYRADLFAVCGKKIVLANQYNLFVYDTTSKQTYPIDAADIYLRYQKGALYGPRLVDSDDYLLVTVNEPTKVKGRAVIKVLDLSDEMPQIISLSNLGFTVSDVSSVKVSAKHGYVAVGSSRKQAIFAAPIAQGAKLKKFDISGYDSFGEMDMALLDKYVVYQDKAGFSSVRALNLDSGEVMLPDMANHGGSWGTTAATNGNIVTWPTKDPRSTFVVSDYLKQTQLLANTGEAVSDEANYGKFGMGNVAAVVHDGTIFLSGSQSISETKCLQMSAGDRWLAVTGSDGKPIPAIDVVAGNAMIAFKTGKRSSSGPVSISYATFGERIEYAPAQAAKVASATAAKAAPQPRTLATPRPQQGKLTEVQEAFLKTTLDAEQQIYKALKNAIGEEQARQRTVEASLNALKASGHADLVERYKKLSSLAK